MTGKAYQSCLIPYRIEIFALRSQKPPVSYARIAEILREKHGLIIQRAAIGKFVKVKAKGRKIYFFKREQKVKRSLPPSASVSKAEPQKPKFEWNFIPSKHCKTILKANICLPRRMDSHLGLFGTFSAAQQNGPGYRVFLRTS
jgi:hypothetical protein